MWMAIILSILWSGHDGPLTQLTDMLRSMATVTRSAGEAASLVFDGGAGIAIRGASAMLGLSASGYDVLESAWHGIDLLEVRTTAGSGNIVAAAAEELGDWLEGSSGAASTSVPLQARHAWASLCRSASLTMPAFFSSLEYFDESGTFEVHEATISLASTGHFRFHYRQIQISFRPLWANPLWELLEPNLTAEHQQIRSALD